MRERLIGAAVLVIIAVILVPWLVSRAHHPEDVVTRTAWPASANAPARPYVLPLQSTAPATSSVAEMPPSTARTTSNAVPSAASTAAKGNPPSQPAVSPHKSTPAHGKSPAPVEASRPALSGWLIQAASFANVDAARTLKKRLEQAGFAVNVSPNRVKGTTYYRVLVGPYPSKARAQSAALGVARISNTKVLIRSPGSGKG